jgi:phenylalanyl-tRNA synthetase alpha chain
MKGFESEIGKIRESFLRDLKEAIRSQDIEELRIKYLGKKGSLSAFMKNLKDATETERPLLGKLVNDLKEEICSHIENNLKRLSLSEQERVFEKEAIDVTLPGRRAILGRSHPVTMMIEELVGIFSSMGFSVQYGPDLDSDFYNFEGLNFPKGHPARDMQDSFYVSPSMLLRTHTSNVQVRVMESHTPPIRIVAPGRCFRNENISARSHVLFHQIEALYIDKGVAFTDLMSSMEEFLSKFFKKEVKTRFRPSYFPFVEPGMEVDVRCTQCSGQGCRLCKHSGWLEILGAGMVHPNVLKAGGLDPEVYSGYAWGLGIERMALLRYEIPDIRLLTENDMRFLEQFREEA